MTDIEDEDSAEEGHQMGQLERWAIEDAQMTFQYVEPQKFFQDNIEQRVPDRWNYNGWRRASINYLIDSYRWWRVHGDQVQPKVVMSKNECAWMAYKETYEWMYKQLNPRTLHTRSEALRGW